MATISGVTSNSAAGAANGGTTTASRVPQKTLNQDDFMKLLAVQFQMQDPTKPLEDTAFIAQTAQFAALQQSSSMTQQLASLRTEQQRVTANSYLGLKVTVDAGDGQVQRGTVSAVSLDEAEPSLVVGGQKYPLSAVLLAEPVTGTTPAPGTTGTL